MSRSPDMLRPDAAVTLRGPDHTNTGQISTCAVREIGALGISVGRFPKPYVSIDPNEDAALFAIGGGRAVAAVIDGHLGFTAAGATLRAVEEELGLLLGAPQGMVGSALQTVLARAEDCIAGAIATAESELASSRTAVSLAVADGNTVFVATVGDTVAALVNRRAKKFRSESHYLGPRHGPVTVHRKRWKPGDFLFLASDGFTDYAGLRSAVPVVAAAASPEDAARAAVTAALDGGAGDNVTVAVVDLATLL